MCVAIYKYSFFDCLCWFATITTQLIKVGQLLPPLCLVQCHRHYISNCDDSFIKHLEVLKAWYCELKLFKFTGSSSLHHLLDCWRLDVQ
jgi:hypothetical protein